MEIDKKSEEWKISPWYVKFSALGTSSTEMFHSWSSVLVVIGSAPFCLSLIESSFRFPAFAFLIGAYSTKSTELWVTQNLLPRNHTNKLHIADATARVLNNDEVSCVGLLGTRFTMEQGFYIDRLQDYGIQVVVPDEPQRDQIHSVIYTELCRGVVKPQSKTAYLDVVASLAGRGAQGVILGCTEIGLLIQGSDTEVRLYDTAEIHADQAVEFALGRT